MPHVDSKTERRATQLLRLRWERSRAATAASNYGDLWAITADL